MLRSYKETSLKKLLHGQVVRERRNVIKVNNQRFRISHEYVVFDVDV
jgi:hypothetical protein